jgi:peptidyl-prolyl cis-trans isomerase B (cyclophilin B)
MPLTSCGTVEWCEYYAGRDTTDREIHYVKMDVKDHGSIVLLLDATSAPGTVENFLELVEDHFYDGITFHRIIDEFMIQGGDPTGTGVGGSEKEIYGEFSKNGYKKNDLLHKRGVISMARSSDNNSASSQFFICNADSAHLDGSYAAFGYVIYGMSTVDSITSYGIKHTTNGVIQTLSKQPKITAAYVLSEDEAAEYLNKITVE